MKKRVALVLTALTLLFCMSAHAENTIKIYIDGEMLECEAAPVNIDDRVLVPVRAIFESLGAELVWNGEQRVVRASRDGEAIMLTIDRNEMNVGVYNSEGDAVWAESVYLDVPARIINDYTYVPVRAVSEALRANVSWDGDSGSVIIDSRNEAYGALYYVSDSDYQKLYTIGTNGQGRRKLSDRSVRDLETYDNHVYYTDRATGYLYRSDGKIEECMIAEAAQKIAIEDGWIYCRLGADKTKYGQLVRVNIKSGETERLSDKDVIYPVKYKDYIYFNVENDNSMYGVSLDGTRLHEITLGDGEVRLYPFNCLFFGEYILVENGAWYGNIMRMNLDGGDLQTLTQSNSIIAENQEHDGKIVYINPDDGQDIYCVNTDGSNDHILVDADPMWVNTTVLAQYGDTIYYKNSMRGEVYRIKLDGSGNSYTCYADDVKVYDGRLFALYNGLYVGAPDGSGLEMIYDGAVEEYRVDSGTVYIKDKNSGRLHKTDIYGNKTALTNDKIGEWVTE